MNIIYTPSYEDPMYNKNFFDEYELECKYQEDFGAVLEPWKNQFPEPIEYSSKRSIWFRGDLYEFKIFDGKVIVSTFNQSSDWKIYYSHFNSETERKMKNLSFPVPNNMAGSLNNIKINPITGVKIPDEGGYRPNCGVQLNCIYLELSKESWVYIRKDHPLITKEIDKKKIRFVDALFFDASQIYYMCDQPFSWFKINPDEFPISYDNWLKFWGGGDFKNHKFYEEE